LSERSLSVEKRYF